MKETDNILLNYTKISVRGKVTVGVSIHQFLAHLCDYYPLKQQFFLEENLLFLMKSEPSYLNIFVWGRNCHNFSFVVMRLNVSILCRDQHMSTLVYFLLYLPYQHLHRRLSKFYFIRSPQNRVISTLLPKTNLTPLTKSSYGSIYFSRHSFLF